MRRRGPCSGFVRGLQRTEAETKMGGIADTFQTRRVLMEEFRMMCGGCLKRIEIVPASKLTTSALADLADGVSLRASPQARKQRGERKLGRRE